jgi:hypothetical protein
MDTSGFSRIVALLIVQVCCVALAVIAVCAARKTFREGFHVTDTRKAVGATARILGGGAWLLVAAAFLAIGLVAVPMRSP